MSADPANNAVRRQRASRSHSEAIVTDEDLVLRASIKDDLSRPLEHVEDKFDDVTAAAKRTERATSATARAADMAESRFTRLARGGLSRVQDVARTATRYVAYGATALVGAGVAAVGWGVKVAASMQTARIAFATMLGSGRKADAFLKKLSAFAEKTPFEFPELQTAASSLISAGIEADKVIPIMTTLGDVTSGMGTGSEGVRRATIALQQMSAAGRITGEDLNQLRDAGIPVYELLAKATGRSTAEVVALSQAGKLGAQDLSQMMKALETGKGLERFSGLMDKQSASLTGVASTFKDKLGQGLAKALKPAIPVLTKLTVGATVLVGAGVGPLADGIGWLIKCGERLHKSGDLQKWASTAKTEVVDFWNSVGPLAGELFELGRDALPVVGATLGVVVGLIKTGAQVLEPLVAGFNELPGSAKNAMILAAAVYLLSQRMGGLRDRGTQAMETLRGVDRRALLMRGAVGLAGGAMLTFAGQVGESHQSLGDLMTIGGSIAIGMAAGGPVGAAIGGLGGVLQVFTGQSQRAAEAQERLDAAGRSVADTLDRQTGLLGENTRQIAAKQLAESGALTTASKLGLSYKTVLDASLGNAAAQRQVAKATDAAIKAQDFGSEAGRKAAESAANLAGQTYATSQAIAKERRELRQTGQALESLDGKTATIGVNVNTKTAQARLDRLNRSIEKAISGGNAVGSASSFGRVGSTGDTATRHGFGGSGRGRLGRTFAVHNAVSGRLGGGYSVTNALVGGGGSGLGSGDHQAGRALDVVGRNLPAYAREVRAQGGYARIHGEGGRKHVHAVMGDTATPRGGSVGKSTFGASVTVGDINVYTGSDADPEAIGREVKRAIDQIVRELEETSA